MVIGVIPFSTPSRMSVAPVGLEKTFRVPDDADVAVGLTVTVGVGAGVELLFDITRSGRRMMI